MEPLKLYVNKSLVAPGMSYIPLLHPFWGPILKESNPYVSAAYEKYGFTSKGFILTESIEESDYVLVPNPYWPMKRKHPALLAEVISQANAHTKPLLIDASGDLEWPVDVPNSQVLRIGQYRFQQKENEIAIPVPAEDFLENSFGGILPLRKKGERAVIGFSGWAEITFWQWVKMNMKGMPYALMSIIDSRYGAYMKGVLMRRRVIKCLKKATRIISNFIIRKSYSAHIKTIQGDFKTNRQEFLDNLLNSDYALSVRGDANADTRFYEAISLGRIPLFIDTERVMPLQHIIDYSEFCLIVDFREIKRLEAIVADFHSSLAPEKFIQMQRRAREVFEQYLRNDSFTPHLAALLKERLRNN